MEKKKKWKLWKLYLSVVAAICSIGSLVSNSISLFSKDIAKVVTVIFCVAVFLLMCYSKNYKTLDKVHDKEALSDTCLAWTTSGIFYYFISSVLGITAPKALEGNNKYIYLVLMMVLLLVGVIVTIDKLVFPIWEKKKANKKRHNCENISTKETLAISESEGHLEDICKAGTEAKAVEEIKE